MVSVTYIPATLWRENAGSRQQPYWDEHADFMDKLFSEGKILLGGPFADKRGALVILNSDDEAAAHEIFSHDPWVVRGVYMVEVRAWEIFLDGRDR